MIWKGIKLELYRALHNRWYSMRIKAFILILCVGILSGCASKSDNKYKEVEEMETTGEIEKISHKETETTTDNNLYIDKDMVKYYIDDSHFYDNEDGLDFAKPYEEKEKFHIKVLNAYTSDNLRDFGEYFYSSGVKGDIDDAINWCKTVKGYTDEDLIYLCVQIELTNISGEEETLCVADHLTIFTRINDGKGKEYNLPYKYINYATAYNEFKYDSDKKENEGKSYYFFSLEAGETITTNCVYILRKEYLDDDLYFQLHLDEGEYNAKYNCTFPPTAETTKFLKINLNKNN